ncbi:MULTISPECIES: hypothetical protein [Roseobacteraceae]|uniref:Uncharacterized protein n=1 Tax=Pseudosulfitobacter pseudonitzschiae TaxID=1402135 RepID=A0A221JXY9_9RHOB|nr:MULTISPECIES: hypothetical protein [Roseobacteraceae]ASM71598.1 hypothetical protein SULPSESMR1_00767 [Pseudosulfitobacter pseudonitzschiae]
MTSYTQTAEELMKAIVTYNEDLGTSKDLINRLSNNVSWYFFETDGVYHYGPSKWVGYKDMDAETYIRLTDSRELGGQLTEASLASLRRQVAPNTSEHLAHYDRLTKMLAAYGKVPNKRVRFNAIVSIDDVDVEEADRNANLVALISAVIRTLPESAKTQLKREFFL